MTREEPARDASTEPVETVGARAGPRAPRRFRGKGFAVGFGLFLIVSTAVFTYLARQAQRSREEAFDRMERDGVVAPGG